MTNAALVDGFDGIAVRVGPNHSTVEIWYDTEAQACAALLSISGLMDRAEQERDQAGRGGVVTSENASPMSDKQEGAL